MGFLPVYLLLGLIILGLMTLLWLLSLAPKNSSIVDVFWGSGFVIITWVAFLLMPDGFVGRKLLLIERVFAHYRWTRLLEKDPSPGGLVRFHTGYKLTLMAHSPKHYQELGRLVAQAGVLPWDELIAAYGVRFMQGLTLVGTRRKHVNVLQHLMGYLKDRLSSEDKLELLSGLAGSGS